MLKKDTFFLISFIGMPPTVGSFQDKATAPQPHVTFLAHMEIAPDNHALLQKLVRGIAEKLESTSPFLLTAQHSEFFGVKKDKEVQILSEENNEATCLHSRLLVLTQSLHISLSQPEFTGANFRQHVSIDHGSQPLPLGTPVLVNYMTLVQHVGGYGFQKIRVIAHFNLGQPHHV
jgi:hypothetical protein